MMSLPPGSEKERGEDEEEATGGGLSQQARLLASETRLSLLDYIPPHPPVAPPTGPLNRSPPDKARFLQRRHNPTPTRR